MKVINNTSPSYKLDHISIAVENLETSIDLYVELLGLTVLERRQTQGRKTGMISAVLTGAGIPIVLVQGTEPDSQVTKFVKTYGAGVQHIAFAVDDIFSEINRLQKQGFIVLNETPKKGADNKLVVFLHPKSTNGVLIELCQEIN